MLNCSLFFDYYLVPSILKEDQNSNLKLLEVKGIFQDSKNRQKACYKMCTFFNIERINAITKGLYFFTNKRNTFSLASHF